MRLIIKLFLAAALFTLIIVSASTAEAQTVTGTYEQYSSQMTPDRMDKKYIAGEDGIVRMYVNIWGHVSRPGSFLVYDGIDLVTLFSICGGPKQGANLSHIKLIRETPDENGEMVYHIDFNEFVTKGDRTQMVKIKPNDTIIVGQTTANFVLTKMSLLNTVLQMFNIYLQIQRYK